MLTLNTLHDELHRLIERGLSAQLDPAEIADALQAELDELDVMTRPVARSGILKEADPRDGRNRPNTKSADPPRRK